MQEKRRQACLLSDLVEILWSFVCLRWCLMWVFHMLSLLYWTVSWVSLYSQVCFSEVVNNFKFSFASHELVMWSLPFMNVLDYIKYFRFAEPSLHLLDEINFIVVDNHFYVFLNTVLKYFVGNFTSTNNKDSAYNFLIMAIILLLLSEQYWLMKGAWDCSFASVLQNNLRRTGKFFFGRVLEFYIDSILPCNFLTWNFFLVHHYI